jgi:hypothetical protein
MGKRFFDMHGNRGTQFTPPRGRLFLLVIFIISNISGLYRLYAENDITPFPENFALNLHGNFNLV